MDCAISSNGIGENLYRHRKLKGLSRQSLAEKSGITEQTIFRIEKGKSTADTDTLKFLADALGIKIYDLTDDKPTFSVKEALDLLERSTIIDENEMVLIDGFRDAAPLMRLVLLYLLSGKPKYSAQLRDWPDRLTEADIAAIELLKRIAQTPER